MRAKSTARSSGSAETAVGADALAAVRGRSVACIGGGTGLAEVLRGLKPLVTTGGLAQLTGVVTVTDDGGSSGRLRREFGVLPPGDIRNCIVALADDEDLLARLFQYRFTGGRGLGGHSFGNLFLTALTGVTGDFYQAILTAESVLSVRGRILPATLSDVQLRGRGRSGRLYEGEVAVGNSHEQLDRLQLDPAEPEAFPAAVQAIESADLVLLGPGSLYTSILPNLLIPGIRDALYRTRATRVLLLNLMTQPGETDGMSGVDHLDAIEREAGLDLVDWIVANTVDPALYRLAAYAEKGASPVLVDGDALRERGLELLETDLLARGDLIRHEPAGIRQAVVSVFEQLAERGELGATVQSLPTAREAG